MDSIEQKALALVNEAFREPYYKDWPQVPQGCLSDALIRAIEQHEAFRQEVSDEIVKYLRGAMPQNLNRFIIAKPDPLVEALEEWINSRDLDDAASFRAAIEKRGGKIVWGEG